MPVEKQPDDSKTLNEGAIDWFRQFLKHLEVHLADTGQGLFENAEASEYCLAAMRAVKLTLLDSGLDDGQILELFGRAALESRSSSELEWTDELNQRRFELIDRDIQGTLSSDEQVELAGLTQLMREHVSSDFPLEGAKKLHRRLTDQDSDSTDSKR